MSNNKQSIKLYTEKQLEIAMAYVHAYHESDTRLKDEEILKKLTPIELPTDEEIEDYARQSGLVHPFITRGAKWMRDQIQGGNK